MEKTFEELIEEKSHSLETESNVYDILEVADVLQLMQQVREATIAECSLKVFHMMGNSPESFEICARIDELPTDRIKTP